MILLTAWRYHWRLGRPFEFTDVEGWEAVTERVKVRSFFLDTRTYPVFFADVREGLLRNNSSRMVAVKDDWSIAKLATEQVAMGAWWLHRRAVDPTPQSEVIVEEAPVPVEAPPPLIPPESHLPEPDPPTLDDNADSKAIADAQREASRLGLPFCEECMRAKLAAQRNEKEKPVRTRPEIRVQPMMLDFGALAVKRGVTGDIFTIMSVGTAPLQISSIGLSSEQFELVEGTVTSAKLEQGESMSVEVIAHPLAEGPLTARLQISSNAANVAGAVPVSLVCEGIRPLIEVEELAS